MLRTWSLGTADEECASKAGGQLEWLFQVVRAPTPFRPRGYSDHNSVQSQISSVQDCLTSRGKSHQQRPSRDTTTNNWQISRRRCLYYSSGSDGHQSTRLREGTWSMVCIDRLRGAKPVESGGSISHDWRWNKKSCLIQFQTDGTVTCQMMNSCDHHWERRAAERQELHQDHALINLLQQTSLNYHIVNF